MMEILEMKKHVHVTSGILLLLLLIVISESASITSTGKKPRQLPIYAIGLSSLIIACLSKLE